MAEDIKSLITRVNRLSDENDELKATTEVVVVANKDVAIQKIQSFERVGMRLLTIGGFVIVGLSYNINVLELVKLIMGA